MIPFLSSAEVQLETSASFDCDDQNSQHRSKHHQEHQTRRFLPSITSQSLESPASFINSAARSDILLEAPCSSCSSHSSTSSWNQGVRRRRRLSSVSFQETLDILEVEKLVEKSTEVVPGDIWYTKEELREIRSQCKQQALEMERNDRSLERGLEHMVPRGSPRHSTCRRNSKNIVFLEQANEILEHGFLCHTDQLADEYRRASEVSKLQARSRGCKDAVHAWGDLRSKQAIVSNSIIIRNPNEIN